MTEAPDKEIYQAVIDAINARENIETNGGDDFNAGGPPEPLPSRRDVLKAVSTIIKYIGDLNDPFACNMETILGLFTRQICLDEARNMKETFMTDYFANVSSN
jgi:hypothetical protein